MRMPRVTIRRMMVAVAVVGLLAACAMQVRKLRQWSWYYRMRVKAIARPEQVALRRLVLTESGMYAFDLGREKITKEGDEAVRAAAPDKKEKAERTRLQIAEMYDRMAKDFPLTRERRHRAVAHYASLKRKYERASRYP